MTAEEQFTEIRAMLKSPAAAVVHHDDQIEAHDRHIEGLIAVAEKHSVQIEKNSAQIAELARATERTLKATENLERQWQAYINTLPRH